MLSALAVVVLGAMVVAGQEVAPGSGATMPRPVKVVKAVYTPEGRAARIEGRVLLSAVVRADGTVSDVKVVRSLDTKYGLDTQAVNASKQWTFTPATRDGRPVAVSVTIEQEFFLKSTR
jgi:protein TonB